MTCPHVSVIIPVYNSARYLEKLYNSLSCQTNRNIEMIFIDDGSTDDSLKLLKNYKLKDSRVRLISLDKNLGPSYARNLGLGYATGEYICFFDSDDYVELHTVEEFFKSAEAGQADLVVSGYIVDKYRNGKHIKSDARIPRQFDQDCCLGDIIGGLYLDGMLNTLCNKLFRRTIIEKHDLKMNEHMFLSEDVNFVIDYLKHVEFISIVYEPLYHIVRRNIESLTTKYHENMLEIQMYTIKNMKELLIPLRKVFS